MQNGTENSCAIQARKIRLLSPSGPTGFPKDKELRTSSISEGVIIKELKETPSATYLLILGRTALHSLSSVWSLKKLLRRLALSVSSEYMIPPCSRVGMEEFVVGEIKNLRVVHQSFAESVSGLSLFARLCIKAFFELRIIFITMLRRFLNLYQLWAEFVSLAFLCALLRLRMCFLIFVVSQGGSEGLILMLLFEIYD